MSKWIISFVVLILLPGCQWTAYNSYDYVDGIKTTETHVGTIEFCVYDDKTGLSVELADGTQLGLAATTTDLDEEAIKAITTGVMDALRLWTTGGL